MNENRFYEIRQLWKVVKTTLLVVGILLSFFAVVEMIRIYVTLRDFHPLLGYAFGLVVIFMILLGLYYFVKTLRSRPKVLVPPAIQDIEKAEKGELKKYCKYLVKYLRRLEDNDLLNPEERENVRGSWETLERTIGKNHTEALLRGAIHDTESSAIDPIQKKLDEYVEREIRNTVRDVMLVVALLPYRSADLFIVIYRNLGMVRNITTIYNSRPGIREMVSIILDTARVVATVNYLNLCTKMVESVFKRLFGQVPLIGEIIDDCAQGFGAGLLTSMGGHAAKDRCRGYRKWDYTQAQKNISSQLNQFALDVRNIFFHDVWPQLRKRSGLSSEKWGELTDSVSLSFNETIDGVNNFVKTTTYSGIRGLGYVTSTTKGFVSKGARVVGDATVAGGKSLRREAMKATQKTKNGLQSTAEKTQNGTDRVYQGLKKILCSLGLKRK